MVKLKQKSKRITCKRRYRIEKKIKDHNKKTNKEAKKNENKPSKRLRNMRIPNKFPMKEEILEQAEREKQARLDEKKKKQQEKKKRKSENKKLGENGRQNGGAKSLGDLLKQAQSKQSKFENQTKLLSLDNPFAAETYGKKQSGEKENSLRTFYKEFKKVCDASDVLVQVLDARDPLGTRCPEVEQMISNSGKNQKLIFLLNKIDLVPKENVKAWLKYLRALYPTVAFKASTQSQNDKLSQSSVPVEQANQNLLTSSKCLGADILVKLLNNFSRVEGQDIKTTITVGIIGLPNVGKSSIINSLKRSHACMIGSMPGLTRHMKEIKLDKHIKLLDCPGIVMSREEDSASLALKNCIKVENLADPIAPIDLLLKRCNKDQLVMKYNISDEFETSMQFLTLVAKRCGKVKKGGVADIRQAAQLILNDWNGGRLTYYTRPPSEVNAEKLKPFDTKIVSQLAPKFDIDALLLDDENAMFEDITDDTRLVVEGVEVESALPIKMASFDENSDDEYEDMVEEEEENGERVEFTSDVMLSNKKKRKAAESEDDNDEEEIYETEDIPRTKKKQKIESKKKLKKARRNDKLFNNLGDMLNSVKIDNKNVSKSPKNGSKSSTELYDFKADFKK